MTDSEIEKEMHETALRHAVWIALYHAQKLHDQKCMDRLAELWQHLLRVEVTK